MRSHGRLDIRSRARPVTIMTGALALALAVAACGSSGSSTSSTQKTAAATASTTSTAPTSTTAPTTTAAHHARPKPHPASTHPKPAPRSTTTTHPTTTTAHTTSSTTTAPTTSTTTTHAAPPPAPTYTRPIHATLVGANHDPTANKLWPYTVTAKDANGRPLPGTVDIEFTFNGIVVGHDTPPTHRLSHGRWHDTLTYPTRALGQSISLQAVVHTSIGSVTLDWAVKVRT